MKFVVDPAFVTRKQYVVPAVTAVVVLSENSSSVNWVEVSVWAGACEVVAIAKPATKLLPPGFEMPLQSAVACPLRNEPVSSIVQCVSDVP